MPKVPFPEGLKNSVEILAGFLKRPDIPPRILKLIQRRVGLKFPIEIKPVFQRSYEDAVNPKAIPPKQYVWFRVPAKLNDKLTFHQCVGAYASDLELLATCLLPHAMNFYSPKLSFMVSLDHCVWFHEPFRADEWLLYEMEVKDNSEFII
jgi:acyl-CoA thioesterase II